MAGNDKRMDFDVNTAKEMVDAFSVSTGISCRLYLSEGELLYAHNFPHEGCSACKNCLRHPEFFIPAKVRTRKQ